MGSGLSGLHMKGALIRKSFTIFWDLLALGGVVLPGSARPRLSKHQNKKYMLGAQRIFQAVKYSV